MPATSGSELCSAGPNQCGLDPEAVRADFPFLQRTMQGKPPVYFDNAATSQKPRQVLQTLNTYYEKYNSNVGRSSHTVGLEAAELYRQARANVARFIAAESPQEVLFVRGCTEGINLLAYSLLQRNGSRLGLEAGDEVVITIMEHHSNLLPWRMLRDQLGVELKVLDIRDDGTLDMNALPTLLSKRTKLVCCTHVSNVLGTVNPLAEIAELTHDAGALLIVDAAQSVPHMPMDVRGLGCDFMAFSGHKTLAPQGVGVLYGKKNLLEQLLPFQYGGGMVRDFPSEQFEWRGLPEKFEAGTPNVAGAISLGGADGLDGEGRLLGALDYLKGLDMRRVRAHELALSERALRGLAALEGIKIYGPTQVERRGGLICFSVEKNGQPIDDHLVAQMLDQAGISVRAGGHCAHPLIRRLGIKGAVRVSFHVYNTIDEVDFFLEVLQDAVINPLF